MTAEERGACTRVTEAVRQPPDTHPCAPHGLLARPSACILPASHSRSAPWCAAPLGLSSGSAMACKALDLTGTHLSRPTPRRVSLGSLSRPASPPARRASRCCAQCWPGLARPPPGKAGAHTVCPPQPSTRVGPPSAAPSCTFPRFYPWSARGSVFLAVLTPVLCLAATQIRARCPRPPGCPTARRAPLPQPPARCTVSSAAQRASPKT